MSRHARRLTVVLGIPALVTAIGCGSPQPVTPPVVNNSPPVIESVAVAGQRAEAGRDIQVTASVKDTETPVAQLTYTWSASPSNGSFTGTGATVAWRPPVGQPSPAVYTITLTVTESYTSAGQPRTNTVSASTTVRYNDSPAETIALATQFIKDFGTFELDGGDCVRNFSDKGPCKAERDAEEEQIDANRVNFRILSATLLSPAASFNGTMTAGEVLGQCIFEDIPNPPHPNAGKRQIVRGTCQLTTVYEDFRWYLCASHFYGETTLASVKGRVPGRIRLN